MDQLNLHDNSGEEKPPGAGLSDISPNSSIKNDAPKGESFYTPLDPANDEIRVLILRPGSVKDPLEGRLSTVPLEKATTEMGFFALSYTWGEQTNQVEMTFEGHQILIGRNLAAALVSIRNEGEVAYILWVDALCINQKDTTEKMDQVQKMKRIYESAKAVIVWLGDEFDGIGDAFDWLKALPEYTDVANGYWDKQRNFKPIDLSSQVTDALCRLTAVPWWRRVWIIQEIVVCRTAVAFCGKNKIPFASFSNLSHVLQVVEATGIAYDAGSNFDRVIQSTKNSAVFEELRANWHCCTRLPEGIDLGFWLRLVSTRCLSTEPHDRIYALLGISSDDDRHAIKPDYTISKVQVYRRATIHIIQLEKSFDILQLGERLARDPAYPSWLPGWDQKALDSGPRLDIRIKSRTQLKFTLWTNSELSIMKVSGVYHSKLDTVASPFHWEGDGLALPTCLRHWYETLSKVVGSAIPDPYAESCGKEEAFAYTLTAGTFFPRITRSGRVSPGQACKAWLAAPDVEDIPSFGSENDLPHSIRQFRLQALGYLKGRTFCITESGYLCLAPRNARIGDIAVILGTHSAPVCLRPVDGHYEWIGSMYVHEAMKLLSDKSEALEEAVSFHPSVTEFEVH
ncbi:heterokaryon incompatibility protein-domain-containing protein [Bisporella sp. PMI_857]|nr:heterokaryon incompatibility protein-domain-containing protein [Bisporella sp. PMI_857]